MSLKTALLIVLILVIISLGLAVSDRILERDRERVIKEIVYTGHWPIRKGGNDN